MPIFIYYFDCILQGSKFINAIAFRMVNIYLCLLLGNLHTTAQSDQSLRCPLEENLDP